MEVEVSVVSRSKKNLGTFKLNEEDKVRDFKNAFFRKCNPQADPQYSLTRQWFTVGSATGEPLKDDKLRMKELGTSKLILVFKDLGPQISWRLVYFLEYLGPLAIFSLLYYYPDKVYGREFEHSRIQQCRSYRLAYYMLIFHFVKREIETLTIHRFSNATMPLKRLPINCGHYWGLCGGLIGFFLFHPDFRDPGYTRVENLMYSSIFLMFETLNFNAHIILRNLRPEGTRKRGIPSGAGFQLVSCANYMWEICVWATFALYTQCFTAYVFLIASVSILMKWSQERHQRYLKEFDGRGGRPRYPSGRKALIPFIY